MDQRIGMLAKPEEVEYTEELIDIEKQIDAIPFNHHKMKQHEPSGPAFHEKKEKNKKVNNKFDYEASMKKKYKKQYRSKDHR